MPEEEQQGILSHYHESACGGHFVSQKTAMKVLQSGFYWPSLFKEAHQMCRVCDRCQRLRKLSRRHMMPLNPILVVELFDVWGIDFMGPFPTSYGHTYILVGVDYVSKWVEAIPCRQFTTGPGRAYIEPRIKSGRTRPSLIYIGQPLCWPSPTYTGPAQSYMCQKKRLNYFINNFTCRMNCHFILFDK